ncbi:MAG: hypothetical protein K0R90_1591 [Oscillospiraceae bacterium]|nr:hypothetical protein [Oscillospiraceae bacterium]
MFSILVAEDEKGNNIIGRIRSLLHAGRPKIETIRMREASFYIVKVPNAKSIKWGKVISALGKTSLKLVVQQGIELPDGEQVKKIDTTEYSHKILQMTIDYVFRQFKKPLKDIKMCLLDPRGIGLEYARIMIKYCGCLKIVTGKVDIYEDFSEQMLDEYGALVQVSESLENVNDNMLIVAPYGIDLELTVPIMVPVISISDTGLAHTFHSFRAQTPWRFKEIMPHNLDEHEYQAALYECCNVVKLSKTIATRCCCGADSININQMAKNILDLTH